MFAVPKIKAFLAVVGKFDVDAFASEVDIQEAEVRHVGDPAALGPSRWDRWDVKGTPVESWELEDALGFLDVLRDHTATIAAAAARRGLTPGLQCVIHMGSKAPAVSLSARNVALLSSLGADFDSDIYVDLDEDLDEDEM